MPGAPLPGATAPLSSRFARLRVRTAPGRSAAGRPKETLLIEWPPGEAAPTKYWLSNPDNKISFRGLVDLAKLRWRIERDYHDLKQEIGLGQYEGRGWRGFHHHGTLSIAAYGFLISERERIPPSGPRSAAGIQKFALPSGYRPRGAPDPATAPCPQLDCYDPSPVGCRNRNDPSPVPVLHPPLSAQRETEFMMQ